MQVAWSPTSHGMFLSSQAGRGVNLANYVGAACSTETYTDPHTGQAASHTVPRPLPRAPAWMRRRCVARFGWGGRLATAVPPPGRDAARTVSVRTLTLEPDLKRHSEQFEEAMGGNLRWYCSQKAASDDEREREYWRFIEVSPLLHVPTTAGRHLHTRLANPTLLIEDDRCSSGYMQGVYSRLPCIAADQVGWKSLRRFSCRNVDGAAHGHPRSPCTTGSHSTLFAPQHRLAVYTFCVRLVWHV